MSSPLFSVYLLLTLLSLTPAARHSLVPQSLPRLCAASAVALEPSSSFSSFFENEESRGEEAGREALRVGGEGERDGRGWREHDEETHFFSSVAPSPSSASAPAAPQPSSLSAPGARHGRAPAKELRTCATGRHGEPVCDSAREERTVERAIQRHRHETSPRDVAFASSQKSFASSYSPFDDEDSDDGGSLRFGQRMKAAVTCPAAKIILGLSGVVALGTLGFKYTRDVLRRRRRQRLERPPTPFTELLGHVLLKRERVHEPVSPSASSPSSTVGPVTEDATGDVLGKPGSVTALYFSGRGVEEMLQARGYQPFTPRLEAIVEGCRDRGQELNVVYLSADADPSDADKHFKEMPWYALPFDDAAGQSVIQKLYRKFRVSTLPHVVLLDEDARVLNPHAYASMVMRPGDFPWRKQTPRELLGDDFVDGEGNKASGDALDNKVVGIYFSASWCPPCQAFTPKLVDSVKLLKEQGKDVEVVFVSNDRDEKSFEEYFKKMEGFLAIPFADTSRRAMLQEALNIRSLPTLVWISKDGEVLTRRGVPSLMEDLEGRDFPWKEKEINDVGETVEGIADEPALILFMEYLDDKEKEAQEQALQEALKVVQSQKNDGSVPPLPRLFTAKKLSPRSIALRRICRQDPASAGKEQSVERPILTILDLIDQSYYVYPSQGESAGGKILTAEEIVNFIKQFRKEELQRNPLSVPE
ncbi:apicoplast-associated thioredoxin family protein Atrx1 [Besnoitia besnoiti]|uniref:Apicoplast-associated thioredoxin family protein Atrx1 n=1 Tax=Besnoitia besnoiti TaxID=94643 RepID=A0A2A9MAE8_BESBE|nr:apicoplast-associated thioredoxin family protein Atrx1 [Besnoitia besnoiti]PFH34174.1 apicoplast-associated thioredoxin family protein Atrx1 [Besnoitia besnoiti]